MTHYCLFSLHIYWNSLLRRFLWNELVLLDAMLSIFLGLSFTLGFKAASFYAEVEKNEFDFGGTEKKEEPPRG